MAKKTVNITLFKVGAGYQITIDPWAVEVFEAKDRISWVTDTSSGLQIEKVVVDFGDKQHFEGTGKKITGNPDPITGILKKGIDRRKYTYELEITFDDTDANGKQRIVIDPDYVVKR